jgi:hypothetical protein
MYGFDLYIKIGLFNVDIDLGNKWEYKSCGNENEFVLGVALAESQS